jgi:hypothetical protein
MRRSWFVLLVTASVIAAAGVAYLLPKIRVASARRMISATVSDVYSLRAALNQYAAENGGLYPPPSAGDPDVKSWDIVMVRRESAPTYPVRSVAWLRPYLQRFFNRPMPETDAWGHPVLAAVSWDRRSYTLASLGSDGQRDTLVHYSWPVVETWHDLIFLDDSFISAPEGFAH